MRSPAAMRGDGPRHLALRTRGLACIAAALLGTACDGAASASVDASTGDASVGALILSASASSAYLGDLFCARASETCAPAQRGAILSQCLRANRSLLAALPAVCLGLRDDLTLCLLRAPATCGSPMTSPCPREERALEACVGVEAVGPTYLGERLCRREAASCGSATPAAMLDGCLAGVRVLANALPASCLGPYTAYVQCALQAPPSCDDDMPSSCTSERQTIADCLQGSVPPSPVDPPPGRGDGGL